MAYEMQDALLMDIIQVIEELGRSLVHWRDDPSYRAEIEASGGKLKGDIAAHQILATKLGSLTPHIPVISEEDAFHELARPTLYWLVDPIDGTSSWVRGFDGFVTQLALIEGDVPRLGIICAPALKLTYVAHSWRNQATRNGVPLPELRSSPRLVVTDNTPEPHGVAAVMMKSLLASGYHESGSIGLKICLVADGTADLFVKDVVVRDWDVAPALLLLNILGGTLTQYDGAPFVLAGRYEKSGGLLVARDKAVWDRARQVITAKGHSPR